MKTWLSDHFFVFNGLDRAFNPVRFLLRTPLGRMLAIALLAGASLAYPASVTFSHDVAPILYSHCVVCHRPGAVAPFSLRSYADAAKRASLIATVVAKRFMPPWLPDGSGPRFQNERRLTASEIATFERWADAGAPEGDPAAAPRAPQFPDGWELGKPDLAATMRQPFDVPADGPDLYQCFAIPIGEPRDRYLRAIDIRPSNSKVAHHVLLFEDVTGSARKRDTGAGYSCFGTPGFLPAHGLGGWTPGSLAIQMPPDLSETLYARADLVLQVHYHPTGKPERDQTSVGLYFTDEPPRKHARDIALESHRIDIPPGDRNYKVSDHFTIPVDVNALGIIPHAHYVCREMYGYAILPNGKRMTLIHIPDWNFDWQAQYRFAAPVRLPADTRVEMEFTYDNSADNPRNPNHPPQRVVWGPGSKDEMAGLHIEVTPVRESDLEELGDALWGKMIRSMGGAVYRRQ